MLLYVLHPVLLQDERPMCNSINTVLHRSCMFWLRGVLFTTLLFRKMLHSHCWLQLWPANVTILPPVCHAWLSDGDIFIVPILLLGFDWISRLLLILLFIASDSI